MTFTPHIFCLMGPTAAGKSTIALEIGNHFPCEIVSVDSVMVYRGMDIGTAKPSKQQQQQIPHHLIDICDPNQIFSAAEFCSAALKLIDEIIARRHYPLLVGGTMLYFRALQCGLSPLPSADHALRQQLMDEAKQAGWQALHSRLQTIDPDAAKRIKPQDQQRIQRALEVFIKTGKTLTAHWQSSSISPLSYPYSNLVLAPNNREELHQQIAHRFTKMLQNGFVDEVKTLCQRGDLNPTLPALRAVGYRQIWQYLSQEITLDDMPHKAIAATRQYAKRQLTWLRSLDNAVWFDSLEDDVGGKILEYMRDVRSAPRPQ